jgi:hypothetical protein
MRGCQRVIAGQTYLIILCLQREFDQFIGDGASDPAASIDGGDEHAGHLAFPAIEGLYRARADDLGIGNRAQKDGSVTVYGFCLVNVRQTRIDEISHKGIRVMIEVLMPNSLDQPSGARRVATLKGTYFPG